MIEAKITNILIKQRIYTRLEQEKIQYGVRIILKEFYKLLLLYSVAFLLNCLLPTFIIHMVFYFIRQVAFGAHFQNAVSCIICSILVFPIMALILTSILIPMWVVWGIGAAAVFLILLKAPVGTGKHPIVNNQHRQYLRKKLYVRIVMINIVLLFSSESMQSYIVYGLVIQSGSMLIQGELK